MVALKSSFNTTRSNFITQDWSKCNIITARKKKGAHPFANIRDDTDLPLEGRHKEALHQAACQREARQPPDLQASRHFVRRRRHALLMSYHLFSTPHHSQSSSPLISPHHLFFLAPCTYSFCIASAFHFVRDCLRRGNQHICLKESPLSTNLERLVEPKKVQFHKDTRTTAHPELPPTTTV